MTLAFSQELEFLVTCVYTVALQGEG
jgi:hypothetical protein